MKRKKHSLEARKKMSKTKKGKPSPRKGVKLTDEIKKNMSRAHLGQVVSEKTRKKLSKAVKGKKSSSWQGGITLENKRIRNNIEFHLWREAVFARDNWTCQKTGIKGNILHPHHIKNFAQYPELRFAIDNGITFSEKSHREFHKIYGFKNNTCEQVKEFLTKK